LKLKLGSIAIETQKCRAAFKAAPKAILAWHCHHEILVEPLTEPAENRIRFILSGKSEHEQALRLHLFRPFRGPIPAKLNKANADWQKAYADRQKAYADRQKAHADRQKADADWQKAHADWQKAYADRQKAHADWQKAYADRQKAHADLFHEKQCKNCPWDGKTIFPNEAA
jgi:tryptophan 2,3-dioxygenase